MNPSENRIHIVGVGHDGLAGLTTRAREVLQAAELVFGPEAVLALLPELKAERVCLGTDLSKAAATIAAADRRRIALVFGGDPLFFGVARYLCDRIGKDRLEVLPHVSSMQLAFARVKETWEDAYLTNLQTHPLETVIDRIRSAETVGLFPGEREGPAEVARQLSARGLDYFRAFVCENLGAPNERVTQGELTEIAAMEFDPLNVLILKRKPGRPDLPRRPARFRRFGNPDDAFAQSRPKSGLITQAEVRALALARLAIFPNGIVWDIGAGSGSVAIEAASLSDPGMVYAIEQDAADYHLILANAETFGIRNLKAVHGIAPAVFDGLPAPDAIFVGATDQGSVPVLKAAWKALRPGGQLVINVATLGSLGTAYAALKEAADGVDVLLVNVARGTEQMETLRFEAVNPSFLLHATKTAGDTD